MVEVNWRAVHIDTENGVQIVPNAALAGDAFVNLSRTTAPYFKAKAVLNFSPEDPPGQVKAALLAVAEGLPNKLTGVPAAVTAIGAGAYRVTVPIASPGDDGSTTNVLAHRAWYAAQRSGLHLDSVKSRRKEKGAFIAEQVQMIATALGLSADAAATMLAGARLLPFAQGEIIQPANSVPKAVGFIADGEVGTFCTAPDGRRLPLGELEIGDYVGATALTRQRMITGAEALTDTLIVAVSREAMNTVVQQDHRLARQIGDTIELRRRAAREALAEAEQGVR